eukprot:gene26253-32175_t
MGCGASKVGPTAEAAILEEQIELLRKQDANFQQLTKQQNTAISELKLEVEHLREDMKRTKGAPQPLAEYNNEGLEAAFTKQVSEPVAKSAPDWLQETPRSPSSEPKWAPDDLSKAENILAAAMPEFDFKGFVVEHKQLAEAKTTMAGSFLQEKGQIVPPLDPEFMPFIMGKRKYLEAVKLSGSTAQLTCALERHDGLASRVTIPVLEHTHPNFKDSVLYCICVIKFLLWQKGGFALYLHGPPQITRELHTAWTSKEAYRVKFDLGVMKKIFFREFQVIVVGSLDEMPADKEKPSHVGGEASGSRLAFDLGKSDFKIVAVQDGEV